MTTTFGGSRLANLRERKTSGDESNFKSTQQARLELPNKESDKISYEPSSLTISTRTQTRLLKGRIQRPNGQTQNCRPQNDYNNGLSQISNRLKLILPPSTEQLKLVLNDEPVEKQDRKSTTQLNPLRNTQKRILIAKQAEKLPLQVILEHLKVQPLIQTPDAQPQKPQIFNQEKPIKQEEVQESMPRETDLVECSEGCGRKFNRKALQKHAKACKLVFMSKRKQFNSEAKRIVTKQQAKIVKQQKVRQKKEPKGKGIDKTSDNWKAASEDFRAAVKAIKKEALVDEKEQELQKEQRQQQMKIIPCNFCQKTFAEVFLEKHLQVCAKKKQTQKKKTFKKK